jgi:hypothetical protein
VSVDSVQAGGPVGAAAAGDPGSGEPGEVGTGTDADAGDAVGARLPRNAVGAGSDAHEAMRTQPRTAGATRLMPGAIGAKTPKDVVWFTARPNR